jgi:branched-chain amino acid transport system substrate-binding protein
MALEEANRSGGYGGLPYRAVAAWSDSPWGTGIAELVRLIYGQRVWAALGSIDGASTHLAEQVVAKTRFSLVSPASTDRSVNLAGVPWMFSCLPPDPSQAAVLAQALLERGVGDRLVIVSATDHDSRQAATAFTAALQGLALTPLRQLEFAPDTPALDRTVELLEGLQASSLLILAGPSDTARLLLRVRRDNGDIRVLGGASMGRRLFLELAGEAAEGVLFPLLCDPSVQSSAFARRFRDRSGHAPDCVAAQAYDAARLLVTAVERAGLDRERIRDKLQELSPWRGVAGAVRWDSRGENLRPVQLATVHNGRIAAVKPRSAP